MTDPTGAWWRNRGREWDGFIAEGTVMHVGLPVCPGGDGPIQIGDSTVEVSDDLEQWVFWHDDCAEKHGFYD